MYSSAIVATWRGIDQHRGAVIPFHAKETDDNETTQAWCISLELQPMCMNGLLLMNASFAFPSKLEKLCCLQRPLVTEQGKPVVYLASTGLVLGLFRGSTAAIQPALQGVGETVAPCRKPFRSRPGTQKIVFFSSWWVTCLSRRFS